LDNKVLDIIDAQCNHEVLSFRLPEGAEEDCTNLWSGLWA